MWHCCLPLTEDKEGHITISGSYHVPLCWITAPALQKPREFWVLCCLGVNNKYLKLHCLEHYISVIQ